MVTSKGRIDQKSGVQTVKIDLKDKRILSLLSNNARMPLSHIAKKVQLSRDAVDYRVKRLQRKGVILHFFPHLNYHKLGFRLYHVFFLLDELNREQQKALLVYLEQHPHVISAIAYSDQWDLELTLLARSLHEFDQVLSDILARFPHIVLEKDTLAVIRKYNTHYVPPLLLRTMHPPDSLSSGRLRTGTLDTTDKAILKHLAKDCRTSTYTIAKSLGVSADTVSYRINTLLQQNIIRRFTLLVDLAKLGYTWYTYAVTMKHLEPKMEKRFESFLANNQNILRSAKTMGDWDLLLYVIVDDPGKFHAIVKSIKNVFAATIRSYQTWLVAKEHFYKTYPEIIG